MSRIILIMSLDITQKLVVFDFFKGWNNKVAHQLWIIVIKMLSVEEEKVDEVENLLGTLRIVVILDCFQNWRVRDYLFG